MPKRTNEFQELVALIERHMAPRCAKIVQSAEMYVEEIGAFREIDVLVEKGPAGRRMKVAVEAKDHGRRLDVTAIDEILGKYLGPGRVPVDALVLVSHRGFTPAAMARARVAGVRLFTVSEAKQADWITIGTDTRAVQWPPRKMPLTIEPRPKVVGISFVPGLPKDVEEKGVDEGRVVCESCRAKGTDHGTPRELGEVLCQQLVAHKPAFGALVAKARRKGRATASIAYTLKGGGLRVADKDYPIERIEFTVEARHIETELNWQTYERRDTEGLSHKFQVASGDMDGDKIRIVLPELLPGMKRDLGDPSKTRDDAGCDLEQARKEDGKTDVENG